MNETGGAADSGNSGAERDSIRGELEATKTRFHELLDSLSDSDWQRKTANSAWNVRQMMAHIVQGVQMLPRAANAAKKGKGFNPPNWLANPANVLYTRWSARGATRASLAAKYDAAYDAMLRCLDDVKDGEWEKGAKTFGVYTTVRETFLSAKGHFEEHAADVKRGLGRS